MVYYAYVLYSSQYNKIYVELLQTQILDYYLITFLPKRDGQSDIARGR
jgi:hypothetical protein